jgi:hypothetical protein
MSRGMGRGVVRGKGRVARRGKSRRRSGSPLVVGVLLLAAFWKGLNARK